MVWVDDDEIAAIAEHLGKSVGEVRLLDGRLVGGRVSLREFANGDCVYFDPEQRTCRVYPVRPKQCRTWPFWRSHLDSPETWQDVKRECPGIDRGNFVSLEEIERLAEVIDP